MPGAPPDSHIEAWNPENRDMTMRDAGKNLHLEKLVERMAPKTKKSDVVLFDDSERNCILVRCGWGRLGAAAGAAAMAPTP